MKHSTTAIPLLVGLLTATAAVAAAHSPVTRCSADAVLAGTVCLDRYEATVWRVPEPTTTNALLVRKIHLGRATEADLAAGGAVQLGTASDNYSPCSDNGQDCANGLYAASLPGEIPASHLTWFQAQEACANSDKRLPTSAEWQVGANGTPDPGTDNGTSDCNIASGQVSPTGSRSGCVSARGALDMVGNLAEWVADWVPRSTACPGWGSFSDDKMCLSGTSDSLTGPGALVRGGAFAVVGGAEAGPLAVVGTFQPFRSADSVGFRCAR